MFFRQKTDIFDLVRLVAMVRRAGVPARDEFGLDWASKMFEKRLKRLKRFEMAWAGPAWLGKWRRAI